MFLAEFHLPLLLESLIQGKRAHWNFPYVACIVLERHNCALS